MRKILCKLKEFLGLATAPVDSEVDFDARTINVTTNNQDALLTFDFTVPNVTGSVTSGSLLDDQKAEEAVFLMAGRKKISIKKVIPARKKFHISCVQHFNGECGEISNVNLFGAPKAKPNQQIVRIGCYHKAFSTYFISLFSEVCAREGAMFHFFNPEASEKPTTSCNVALNRNCYVKPNSDIDIVFVREPFHWLISSYFSHKNTHETEHWPALEQHRKELQTLSFEAGLLKEFEFSRHILDEILLLQETHQDTIFLQGENIITKDKAAIKRLRSTMDGVVCTKHLLASVDALSFQRITGRENGVIDNASHFRTGKLRGVTEETEKLRSLKLDLLEKFEKKFGYL